MESLKEEIASLKNELQTKHEELEEKDKNLHLAGEFGTQLLENNNALSKQLETLTAENNKKIEVISRRSWINTSDV